MGSGRGADVDSESPPRVAPTPFCALDVSAPQKSHETAETCPAPGAVSDLPARTEALSAEVQGQRGGSRATSRLSHPYWLSPRIPLPSPLLRFVPR